VLLVEAERNGPLLLIAVSSGGAESVAERIAPPAKIAECWDHSPLMFAALMIGPEQEAGLQFLLGESQFQQEHAMQSAQHPITGAVSRMRMSSRSVRPAPLPSTKTRQLEPAERLDITAIGLRLGRF
jgi:hypothetical protein